MFGLTESVLALSRFKKRVIMLLADVSVITVCIFLPGVLLSRFSLETLNLYVFVWLLVVPASIVCCIRLGLYRAIVRYVGDQALVAVLKGCLISTGAYLVALMLLGVAPLPIQILLYFTLLVVMLGGARFVVRLYFQMCSREKRKKVIIYGAGETGIQLNKALLMGKEYEAVCFIEDRKSMLGTTIAGLEVEPPSELPSVIAKTGAEQIFLAMPCISKARRREILDALQCYALRVRITPNISDLVDGKTRIEEIRDVDANDLLGRDPVAPDAKLMSQCVQDKVVLVTGAGGSIGSELCRQIAGQGPRALLMLDHSEFALYRIEQEISAGSEAKAIRFGVKALLGSVGDRTRIEHVIKTFGVQTIYHAAAFKHVPMVEHNVVDGVKNNVIGTYTLAKAALENGVSTFVLISTDKAVRPTNVMGASKRLAELILQGLSEKVAQNGSGTTFCMVRFGNVLESSGSVVPLFREQIEKGGPVTVTHPKIIRYFMTIPEAAQLVIQASSLAEGGDVFVLDMGEPIKIAGLAKKMIRLMGRQVKSQEYPGGDIELRYTGLRPGEKLFEELLIGDNVLGTEHPRIMRAEEVSLPWLEVESLILTLQERLAMFDCVGVRELLLNCETGYHPSDDLCDLVWLAQNLQPVADKPGMSSVSSGAKVYRL